MYVSGGIGRAGFPTLFQRHAARLLGLEGRWGGQEYQLRNLSYREIRHHNTRALLAGKPV